MTAQELACQFIANEEGFSPTPYQHPGDRPTIGYGTTFYEDGTPVSLSDIAISKERALDILNHFVSKCLCRVNGLVKVSITAHQQAALTSFEYNTGALATSTLLRKLNAGDYTGASSEFAKWTHCAGKVLPGLVARRARETSLFLTIDGA